MAHSTMRIPGARQACVFFVLALLGACSGADATSPQGARSEGAPETAGPEEAPFEPLGGFEGSFDPATGEIAIRALGSSADDLEAKLQAKADTVVEVPASSSGVPSGGGVVAFSPAESTTSGCPNGGARCGPVRLVNRTAANTLLRNAYAVVTEITPGWSIVNGDGPRSFGFPGVSGTPVAYFYYEHLLATDRPTAATSPESGKVGFRADRTWSFAKTASAPAEFRFKFNVFARQVACTPSVLEESPDQTGYDPRIDRDCDGVPGVSRNRAIFVDPVHGADGAANDGSILRPFRTPAYAVTQASSARDTIVIGAGATGTTTYTSSARLTLSPAPVRFLIGAYDATNGFADRRLDGASEVDPASTFLSFTTATGGYALHRTGATTPLYLEGLRIRVVGGANTTAYAVFDSGGSGASLTLRDVALEAVGGDGSSGTSGTSGARGRDGALASGSSVSPNSCPVGTAGWGGGGGAGGSGFGDNGARGAAGTPGSPGGGGGGGGEGGSGGCGNNGSDGGWGIAGANGAPGTVGSASLTGRISQAGFDDTSQAGTAGTAGTNGGGGGGGGGEEGSCNPFGGNGGRRGSSGGSGGCGATAGTGGRGGGGAFGIFAYSSSGTALVTYRTGVRITTTGGRGGNGGNGGSGGGGGIGGPRASGSDQGGRGGDGGRGGSGGGGAAGNGGPAVCAVTKGAAPTGTAQCARVAGGAGTRGTSGSGALQPPLANAGEARDTFVF